jgi:hypothetical protein
MDISLFLDTLSEVSNHLYLILKQSVQTPRKVAGITLTPEDFLVKVNVAWVGSLDATDNDLQSQRALQRLQTVTSIGVPMGIVTPTNVYNFLQDILDKDPDVETPGRFITPPEDVQLSHVEEQQSEIIRMMNGFDVPVSPDDNDGVHLAVMEEYANSQVGAERLQADALFSQNFEKHLNIHIQSEAMKNGLKTQKAQGGQGSLGGDPRAKKVAKSAS